MHLALSATGMENGVDLFRVEVDGTGHWTYQSRVVEEARGKLTDGDLAQLRDLVEDVPWEQEVLNNPTSAGDRTLFKLEVDREDGDRRLYQFSERMAHLSWQFRDLVHFLRHNVATGGDPLGRIPQEQEDRPPAMPQTD